MPPPAAYPARYVEVELVGVRAVKRFGPRNGADELAVGFSYVSTERNGCRGTIKTTGLSTQTDETVHRDPSARALVAAGRRA